MTTDYISAVETMFSAFNEAWENQTPIIWQGSGDPPTNEIWVRVSQQNVTESQTTLSDCIGSGKGRRYTTSGLLTIQLFAPISMTNGLSALRSLAVTARNVYRGKKLTGDIWFQNCRIVELAPDDTNNIINVVCEYSFDEVFSNG